MTEPSSFRRILHSTSIIGGASGLNILVGLLRTKVAAILLGPAGVGLIGLLQSVMSTASTIASLGFRNVGTRQIAEAAGQNDGVRLATARRALFWGTLGLAVIGAGVFWLLREFLAEHVMGDVSFADAIGWLSPGVALTIAAGSQSALLNGMSRIGDIARVSMWSALLSTALGIGALWIWGPVGIPAFVLSAPLASFLLGHVYVARLTKVQASPTSLSLLMAEWGLLAKLGVTFMLAGLVVTLGQLLVRTLIQRQLGAEALGHFEAAWTISETYIVFVLAAMSTDYYPRLTATIHDHAAVNRLVNEQTEAALLLGGPIFLAMLSLAPWIIEILYSRQFGEASQVVRWQILGDVLRVASWPLGFINLASGDGRTFMLTQIVAMMIFLGLSWMGLPWIGLQATGVAFLCMYLGHLPILYWLAKRRTGFSWQSRVFRELLLVVVLSVAVLLATIFSKWIGALFGTIAAMSLAAHGLMRLGPLMSTEDKRD